MAKDSSSIEGRCQLDLATLDRKHQPPFEPYQWIIGIDEVGWGCIAGDLVLGAVAIHRQLLSHWPTEVPFNLIRDSKKLTPAVRAQIKTAVEQHPWQDQLRVFYGQCSVEHINKYGLASAYDECLRQILHNLPVYIRPYLVFLDGKRVPKGLLPYPTALQIKGDDASLAIGLASIMAKEHRDHHMDQLHHQWPHFHWDRNKGYGTADHVTALRTHGLSPAHRTKGSTTILQE